MDEAPPFSYRPDLAGRVQELIEPMLAIATEWVIIDFYMDEAPPFSYRPDLAGRVQELIEPMLAIATEWVSSD